LKLVFKSFVAISYTNVYKIYSSNYGRLENYITVAYRFNVDIGLDRFEFITSNNLKNSLVNTVSLRAI